MDQNRQKLELLRKELKTWEKGFEIEFERKPTTEDIKQRPTILKKYRLYYSLKKETKDLQGSNSISLDIKENVTTENGSKLAFSMTFDAISPSEPKSEPTDNIPSFSTDPLFVSYFGPLLKDDGTLLSNPKDKSQLPSLREQLTISPVHKHPILISDKNHTSNKEDSLSHSCNDLSTEKETKSPITDEKTQNYCSSSQSTWGQTQSNAAQDNAEELVMPCAFALLPQKASFQRNSSLEKCESKPQNTEEVKHPSVDNSEKELIRHKRKFDEISIQKDDEKSNKYDGFNHINSLDDDSDFSRAVEILLEEDKPKKKKSRITNEKNSKERKNNNPLKGGRRRNFVALNLKRGYKGHFSVFTQNRRKFNVKGPELMNSSESANSQEPLISEEITSLVAVEEPNCLLAVNDNEMFHWNGDTAIEIPQTETDSNLWNSSTSKFTSSELRDILKSKFGFENFREGQEETIRRILQGQSTLLITSTGSGKSLCYQLPTLLLNRVTLVISPLLALMSDQIVHLPSCLSGGCLNSQQSASQIQHTIQLLREGKLQLLFVSPEKLCNERFIALLQSLKFRFGFACVDEAHCISEWSHNFRPSYLRICDVLRNSLQIKCILALTATATKKTEKSICEMLKIPFDGVIRCSMIRSNLNLSVSLVTTDRYSNLIALLRSPPFSSLSSIIVYCMFQKEADELASFLNLHGFDAASYHAGKSMKERRRVQELFMTNKIRFIVATLAFGMGVNKPDVRAVIHFHMPKSPENYIQEVGRAGRDGQFSYCHLFFDESDYLTIASFAHADTVDRLTLKNLLFKIFGLRRTDDKKSSHSIALQFVALPLERIEVEFDMRLAVISTVLVWLELDRLLKILPPIFVTCRLSFYETSPEVLRVKYKLIDLALRYAKPTKGVFEFSLIEVAENLNTSLHETINAFNSLRDTDAIECLFKDKALYLQLLRVPPIEEIETLIDKLYAKIRQLETSALSKINTFYEILKDFCATTSDSHASFKNNTIDELYNKMNAYFRNENSNENDTTLIVSNKSNNRMFLRSDLRIFISSNIGILTSGRQVARIFHGISSPCFSAREWCTSPYWGQYKDIDFNELMQIANEELAFVSSNTQVIDQKDTDNAYHNVIESL